MTADERRAFTTADVFYVSRQLERLIEAAEKHGLRLQATFYPRGQRWVVEPRAGVPAKR